jgi:hypothetical protein
MRQDLNEIPARREGEREPQDEGHEDFQAHLFSVTPILSVGERYAQPVRWSCKPLSEEALPRMKVRAPIVNGNATGAGIPYASIRDVGIR